MNNANNVPPFEIPASYPDALEKYRRDSAFHKGLMIAAENSGYSTDELLALEGPKRIDMDPALMGLYGEV